MTQTTERKLFSDPRWFRLEFELPGLGHVTNLTGIVKNADTEEELDAIDVEFRFGGARVHRIPGVGRAEITDPGKHCRIPHYS
jgi:hypothetical protein